MKTSKQFKLDPNYSPNPKAFFELLRKIYLQAVYNKVFLKFDEYALNFSQRNALLIINRKGGSTPGELAKDLCQKTPSIARLIRSLERRKLITRTENDDDRRQRILKVTPAAQELIKKLDRVPIKRIEEMYSKLSLGEKKTLWSGTQLLTEGFRRISKR